MTGVQTCALPICFPVTIWRVGGELVEYYRDDSGWVNGDCFDEDYPTPELEVMYGNKLM